MDWYAEVLGAQRRGELHVNSDGTIGHAEVGIGDAVLMLAEASDLWPDVPVRAPDSPLTFSHTLHLEVDDVDASTERARSSGATVEREPRDAHRAKEFYEAVLRVPFSSGHPGTWRTGETRPPLGIRPTEGAEPEVQLSYRVDDIRAAVGRVRAAGGHADEPERKPYGLIAECADDQGTTFRLWQPAD
jgi:predicted enzyme related to lactoylglutathione lyase